MLNLDLLIVFHSRLGYQRHISFVGFFLLMLVPVTTLAEPVDDTSADQLHQQITGHIYSAANWLDAFFDDENYQDEENDSKVRLSIISFSEQSEGTEFDVKVSARLKLPHIEDKLQLLLSNNSDEFENNQSPHNQSEDDKHFDLGLRYFLRQADQDNISITGGVRFRDSSPVVYIRPRYRYLKHFSTWDLRFVEKITWYSDSGFESQSKLQLERKLSNALFFRATSQLDWYENEEGLFPKQNFSLSHMLSDNRMLMFHWDNNFETKPESILESVVFRVRYRQQFWRDWLWYEIEPRITFPEDKDYDAVLGLQLKLQVYFGKALAGW